MPITEKQLAANRANAANAVRGAGSRSPEGKTRSACNVTAVYQPINSNGFSASSR